MMERLPQAFDKHWAELDLPFVFLCNSTKYRDMNILIIEDDAFLAEKI